MDILQHISLKSWNTFGIDVSAAYYTEVNSLNDLMELSAPRYKRYVLGGGSNLLLTAPIDGLVIRNCLKGMEVLKEDEVHVWLKVSSGEVWHHLVMHCIDKGWGGIENLALIPGTVGAAPIQNIGAYGVEVKNHISEVAYWDWEQRMLTTIEIEACHFGYRDSIFKHELKDNVFITAVTFVLDKHPQINASYGAIEQELKNQGITKPTVKDIAEAVIRIRRSKLPDPAEIGNAGSFFKNPVVSTAKFEELKKDHEHTPFYPANNGEVKIPAGWLIESCGWKGYRTGNVGVHAQQALVLVNYGNATGKEIWELSEMIVASVNERFGILLEREVGVWS